MAKESWEGFTKRNRSVIVDMMYGQYKSKLQCPTCSRISITFDPYSMVSLGVPSTKKKYVNFSIQRNIGKLEKKQEPFSKNSIETVEQFLTRVSEENFGGAEAIMFVMSTYQSYEYIPPTKTVSEARKKSKRVGLGVRALTQQELSIPVDKRLYIPIANKALETYGYKRSIYQNSLIILSQDISLKEAHFIIY